jgi:phenylacetate-coenzyme A ligase PaaK-like adenylate-forming protein
MISVQVSRALRIALAAQEKGLDLTGVTFMIAGEPPTPAKVAQITRTGARFFPTYGLGEVGRMGMGCANTTDPNDVHLMHDAFVLFSHPHEVEGFDVEVPAFNITTLLPTTPKVMLNVEIDDYGIVEERKCGCAFEALGFTTHLREIRSYSKLTGEGVSLVGSELVHLLEHELPARYGGSPIDYQFQEAEDERGFTRLYLVVSPRVDLTDEAEVGAYVLDALKRSSAMGNAARSVWKSAGSLQVKRAEPVWTKRGKLMPLHIQRATPK